MEHRVSGRRVRTDRRSFETGRLNVNGSRQSHLDEGHGVPGMPESRHRQADLPSTSSEICAMTSRTNRHSGDQHHRVQTPISPCVLERRRQEALERYEAGEPIEVICREMSCSKSWLYKWKNRYQVSVPDWFKEHARRPETSPTKTPDDLEAQIVELRQTLSRDGSGRVGAKVIRDHLRQHGVTSIPSCRTIYRIGKRHAKGVNKGAFVS